MKKIISIFLYLLLPLLIAPLMAQERAVKLNLPSLVLGNFSLAYEHALSDKFSAQLGIGFLPNRNLPGSNIVRGIVIKDTDGTQFAEDIRFSGWSITPELRYYPFKRDMDLKGFYLAPALRVSRYAIKTDYLYTTSGGDANSLQAKGSLTGFGMNVIAGYNVPIAEELTLDIYFGLGGNAARLGVSLTDDGLVAEDYRELEADILSEFGLNADEFPDIISDDGFNLGFYLPTPTIRTGFALGYTF